MASSIASPSLRARRMRTLPAAIALLVGLALISPAESQRPPSSAPSGDVFSSSSCRARYQADVRQIDAQFVQDGKACHGDSGCIKGANQKKAAALQAEDKKLYLCQQTEGPTQGPPPTGPTANQPGPVPGPEPTPSLGGGTPGGRAPAPS